jgi:hypothetical protein
VIDPGPDPSSHKGLSRTHRTREARSCRDRQLFLGQSFAGRPALLLHLRDELLQGSEERLGGKGAEVAIVHEPFELLDQVDTGRVVLGQLTGLVPSLAAEV